MSELDTIALLKKIQEQLISLERKVDTLVNKSQERPFNKERSYSKPFQAYGNGPRPNKGYNDHEPRKERSYSKPFQAYGSGPRENKSYNDRGPRKEFGPKKEFGQGRPFEKRSGSDNRGFSPKKKSFFNKAGTSK